MESEIISLKFPACTPEYKVVKLARVGLTYYYVFQAVGIWREKISKTEWLNEHLFNMGVEDKVSQCSRILFREGFAEYESK